MGLAVKQGGLAERRAMKAFEDTDFPALVKEIQAAAGYDVTIEVDWDTLYYQGAAPQYWAENMTKVYFHPIIESFKAIAADAMGQEALQEKVKTIHICNSDGRYNRSCSLKGHTLVFDHAPDSNVDYVNDRVKELVSFLEKNL